MTNQEQVDGYLANVKRPKDRTNIYSRYEDAKAWYNKTIGYDDYRLYTYFIKKLSKKLGV